jgi:DNA-binding transcriptional regulator YiaG
MADSGTRLDRVSETSCASLSHAQHHPMTSATRGIGKSVHSPDQAAFCELMVRARAAAGLTQQALAFRLKTPQSFVAKYEAGSVGSMSWNSSRSLALRSGPAQADDDPFERWQGQIPTRQVRRQTGHLISLEVPKRTVQRSP